MKTSDFEKTKKLISEGKSYLSESFNINDKDIFLEELDKEGKNFYITYSFYEAVPDKAYHKKAHPIMEAFHGFSDLENKPNFKKAYKVVTLNEDGDLKSIKRYIKHL